MRFMQLQHYDSKYLTAVFSAKNSHTSMGLSLALFGLASLPLAFERTCALPPPVPSDLVAAGLSLLAASNDAARKNAALYFDAAVHYPVLLEGFDAAEGLHRLLYPLRHVVALLQQDGDPAQLRAERQVAYHASRALLQYIRAHLMLHMTSLQRRLRDGQVPVAPPQPHKPLNTSAAAVDEVVVALSSDAKLAEAFVRTRWSLLERVSEQNLVGLILELVRLMPGEERYYSDICLYGLEAPPALELGPSAVAHPGRPSLGDALEAGYAAARQAVRSSNGIRVLLMLLQTQQHLAPAAADRVRALACSAVLGLARDSSIRHILTKLQVSKLLAELVREPVAPGAPGHANSSRREGDAGAEGSAPGASAVRRSAVKTSANRAASSRQVVVPRAALRTAIKSAKGKSQLLDKSAKQTNKAGFELGFTKSNELFVGRLAMIGFASSLVGEVLSGKGALAQLGYDFGLPTTQIDIFIAGLIGFNFIAAFLPTSGTFVPEEVEARSAERKGPLQDPKITLLQPKKFFGITEFGFTKANELFVGRLAQLGFAASLIGEIVTGKGPLAQFGLETGIPLLDTEAVLLAFIALMLFTAVNPGTGKFVDE
eukprot:gene10779-10936_t